MTTPLCVGCGLPAHTDPCHNDPCHNDPAGPLHARIAALEAGINAVIDGHHPDVEDGDVLGDLDRAFGIVKQAAGDNGNLVEDLCKAAGVDWEGDDPVGKVRTRIAALTAEVADLKRQLTKAITHPLAVAMVTLDAAAHGKFPPGDGLRLAMEAAVQAGFEWEDAGCPIRVEPVNDPYTLAPGVDRT